MSDFWQRIEPAGRGQDLEEGLQARIADPLWLLARQWQLGEFRGEDAASPIHARIRFISHPIRTFRNEAEESPSIEDFNRHHPLECRVEAETVLDGLYVIRTDVPAEQMSAEQTVRNYKSLSVVERAFRPIKTIDLKVRPIHHRKPERVRAHVFVCMLAYYVEWHMRQALAPLLFDDHDRATARAQRDSIVAPARRSPAAQAKAATQRTQEGLTVQSFSDLLAQLATIVKNQMRRTGGGDHETFSMTTRPNKHQRRAIDLLTAVKPK